MAILKASAGLGRLGLFTCSIATLLAIGCDSTPGPAATAPVDAKADSVSDTNILFDTGGSDLFGGEFGVWDEVELDIPAVDATDTNLADAATTDTADVVANCPGGPGCPCTDNKECDLLVCLDTPDGKVCAQNCATTCPKDYVCTQFSGGGGDTTNLCAPQYGWRCEPCTASSQCSAPGQAAAACVVYGSQGAFCGSACSQDSDCGAGFVCQTAKTVEGTSSKQCVVIDDKNALPQCPCSKRAVQLGLSTICSNPTGTSAVCSGKRVCTVAGPGGLSACDAPAPATETCNGVDDDCNGATDEIGCDDGNPCTKDGCDAAQKACTHTAEVGIVCDDGDPCTLGDLCKNGSCAGGLKACECQLDADCASQEDGNLCNGTLYCDTATVPYKCKPKLNSAVVCDTQADTACVKANCVPSTGLCQPTPVPDGGLCDDGSPCTQGDSCEGGTCKPGINVMACCADADCVGKEDGNLCNGTLYCDMTSMPYMCKVKPSTVVTCDTSGDTACLKTTCDQSSGKCGPTPVNGVVCDDGNACTVGDACKAGACESGTNICGCQQDSDCAPKEDGDLCNGTLYCDKGKVPYQCQIDPKTVVTCDTTGDTTCAKAACDAKTGKCAAKPVPDGVNCSDGSACTGPDQCATGQCAGPAVSCDDKNPCTSDSCDPKDGCLHASNTAPCSDGNACTLGDVCANGACSAGPPPSCTDGTKNGGETDKDCGGVSTCGLPACPSCPTSAACTSGSDCASKVCSGGYCSSPTCKDGFQNGDETGLDCGGGMCNACPTLLLVATGGATVAGELGKAGTWKTQTFAAPSVDAPSIIAGPSYSLAALRYTKTSDLQDNQVQVLKWNYAGWTVPSALGTDIVTQSRPSLAWLGSNALLVYHGSDFKYYSMVYSGSWTPVAWVGSPQSYGPRGPALATLGGSALLTYIDGGNSNHLAGKVYTSSWDATLDGGAGPDYTIAPAVVGTGTGTALAAYSKSGGAVAAQAFASGTWSGPSDVPQVWSKYPVSMARDISGNVWMAFHGTDEKLYVAMLSKGTWSSPTQVAAAGVIASTPAVAPGLLGTLELAWVDTTGTVWHSTLTGSSWSTPKQVATGAKHVALGRVP